MLAVLHHSVVPYANVNFSNAHHSFPVPASRHKYICMNCICANQSETQSSIYVSSLKTPECASILLTVTLTAG
jgi:hypothetical protein